ncbi:MAG: DUF4912 domain-containing protein [Planctomycetaceae bacterium]|nr:DUF4912 domain-containing protein [Planctomycetaceae bacterium]
MHSLTRKRLATMARRRQLPRWHEMRKDELIDALLADDRERTIEAQDGSTKSNTNGLAKFKPFDKANHNGDHLTIVAVSPEWMRAEWSIAEASLCRVKSAIGQQSRAATPVLRLYEITDDECQTHGRTRVCDTEISLETHEWFVRVDEPGRMYRLQLGMRAHDGEFYGVCSSNLVEMPQCAPSVAVQARRDRQSSREIPPRPSLELAETDVQFEIDADVTVRGRAHPQSVVTIDGEQIPLRVDGTFDWPCQLTDGRHILPVVCMSTDRRREQTIVLAFERNTKRLAEQDRDDS